MVLRALQDRRLTETGRGQIAIGWLVRCRDLLTVLVLVVLPPLAATLKGGRRWMCRPWRQSLVLTFGKLGLFAALMLVIGSKVIPAMLHYIAHTGSREVFRLAVRSVALGVAYASPPICSGCRSRWALFFAGMILSRLAAQPARGRGNLTAARCLRGAVLCFRRHAVRSPGGRCASR